MTRLPSFIIILLIIQMNIDDCIAQNNAPDSSYTIDSSFSNCYINVNSSISGVRIYIDSLFVGFAPKESIKISSGFHLVCLIHPDNSNWPLQAVVETVQLKPDEHITVNVRFPNICRITTSPFNADVTIGDSVYGTTPLILPVSNAYQSISITKKGFYKVTENLDDRLRQFHFNLVPSDPGALDEKSIFLKSLNKRGETPVYLSAGATVLAGAAAAYFKIKADNRYSDYRKTGDPGTLDRVKSLDRAAGVSLFIAEMSLILFSYLLISR